MFVPETFIGSILMLLWLVDPAGWEDWLGIHSSFLCLSLLRCCGWGCWLLSWGSLLGLAHRPGFCCLARAGITACLLWFGTSLASDFLLALVRIQFSCHRTCVVDPSALTPFFYFLFVRWSLSWWRFIILMLWSSLIYVGCVQTRVRCVFCNWTGVWFFSFSFLSSSILRPAELTASDEWHFLLRQRASSALLSWEWHGCEFPWH